MRQHPTPFLKRYWLLLAIFVALLITGLLITGNYGIGWDESQQLRIGMTSFRYIFNNDQSLLIFKDRTYGPFWEVVLIFIQNGVNIITHNSVPLYFVRHYANFVLWTTGIFPLFYICKRLSKYTWLPYLAVTWYIASPRIFGNSFINTKDIAFMVMFLWSTASLWIFYQKPTWQNAGVHALLCAIAICVRILGIITPIVTLGLLAIKWLQTKQVSERKKLLIPVGIFGVACMLLTYAFFPYLWISPLRNFAIALVHMSRYPWSGNILYNGQIYRPQNLPWHYLPYWIFISTPLLYIVTFLAGCLITTIHAVRAFITKQVTDQLVLKLTLIGLFWGPLIAIIVIKSTVYDSWRHVFFIYPYILCIGIVALDFIVTTVSTYKSVRIINYSIFAILTAQLIFTIYTMIVLHPLEYIYFSPILSSSPAALTNTYELDYWDVSYRELFLYLYEHNPGRVMKIYIDTAPGRNMYGNLPPNIQQSFLKVSTSEQADYILYVFRTQTKKFPNTTVYYTLTRYSVPVAYIYQVNHAKGTTSSN